MLTISPNIAQSVAVNTPICFEGSGVVIIPQEDERYLDIPSSGTNWTFSGQPEGIWKRTGGTNGSPDASTIAATLQLALQPFYLVGTNWTFTTPSSPLKHYNCFIGVFDDNDLFYGWCMFKYCGDNPSCSGNTGGNWNASVIWAGVTVATFTSGINFKDQFRVYSDGVYLNINHEANLVYQPGTSYRQLLPDTENFRFHLNSLYNNNEVWYVRTFKGTYQGSVPITWSAPDGGVLTGEGNSRCFTSVSTGAYSICIDSDYDDPVCVDIQVEELYFNPIEVACGNCIFTGDIIHFSSNGGYQGTLSANIGTVIDSLTWQAPGSPGVALLTYALGEETRTCTINVIDNFKVTNVDGNILLGLLPGDTFQLTSNYASYWENLDCPNIVDQNGLISIPKRTNDDCFGAVDCYIRGWLYGVEEMICENLYPDGDNPAFIDIRVVVPPTFPTPEFGGPKPLKWKPETPDYRVITNEFEGGCDETYLRNQVAIQRWTVSYGGLLYKTEGPCGQEECCDDPAGFIGGFSPTFQSAKRLDDFWNQVGGQSGYFNLVDYRTGEVWRNVRFEGTMERDHINWLHSHTRSFTLVWRPCCATAPKGGVCKHTSTKLDIVDPSVPTNLTLTVLGTTSIYASWTPSTDNVGIAGYEIEVNGTVIPLNNTPWYTSEGLEIGSENFYRVRAFDFSNNYSQWTDLESATTDDLDTTPPTIPGDLSASALSDYEIKVEWSAATDNVAVTGYKLLIDGVVVDVGIDMAYIHEDLDPGSTHEYYVRAYDAAGNQSPWSAAVIGTTTSEVVVVDGGTPVTETGQIVIDT